MAPVPSKAAAARSILRRIFCNAPIGFSARLWDGTQVSLGDRPEPFTLVFRHPASFRRLMLRPNTLGFAEAYVNGDLDVEGDIFAAVRLASGIERLRLGFRDRIAIATALWKL